MKMRHCTSGLTLILALAACGGQDVVSTPSTFDGIVTADGSLTGITAPEVNQYLGIPYAAPPVGERRWTPPQPHGPWDGVLEATQFGSKCPHITSLGFGSLVGNEDCLFLNVYTPGQNSSAKTQTGLPVMVWIHGGSLLFGAGSEYDPTPLVIKGDVIVVTFNYRLGVLGWFAHAALDAESHPSANYGLMDQQFALQWVQRNIAAFGGDPDRVTIFGESAGGLSVYANLASPTAADLFHGAIAQSGAYASFAYYNQFILPVNDAESVGATFAAKVGCADQTAECLRAIAAADLVTAQPRDFINPVVDGEVLPQPPGAAFVSGDFNQVPVISGSTHDEYRLFTAARYDWMGHPLTDEEYRPAVAAILQEPDSSPIVDFLVSYMYPLSNYPPPEGGERAPLAYSAMVTDFFLACPAWNAVGALSQHVRTYAYEFNDPEAPLWPGLPPASFPMGAYHAGELPYLMYLGVPVGPVSFTADQQALSDAMISYWTQFAKTGDPNAEGTPLWPPYEGDDGQLQTLKPPLPEAAAMSDFYSDHKCAVWLTPPPA